MEWNQRVIALSLAGSSKPSLDLNLDLTPLFTPIICDGLLYLTYCMSVRPI